MSRTAANAPLTVTRGADWEDEFTYVDDAGVAVDLTGYSARLQIRTVAGEYGTTTTTTLMLELTTAAGEGLEWDTAATGRLLINLAAADHAVLNPNNERKVVYVYALEVYVPAGVDPIYIIPLARGRVNVKGWGIR